MSLREKMNQNPAIVTGASIAALIICLGLLAYQFTGSSVELAPAIPDRAFYSVDDGQTYFEDADDKIPPFTKDGKSAFRAVVFRCGTNPPKVAWLERFPENVHGELKKIHDTYNAAKNNPADSYNARTNRDDAIQAIANRYLEAKQTGSANWVRRYDPKIKVQWAPKCADGGVAQEVTPE